MAVESFVEPPHRRRTPTEPAREPRCPLCGGPNACAPARTGRFDTPCWCAQVSFPPEVLARVDAASCGVACLCAACAAPTGSVDAVS